MKFIKSKKGIALLATLVVAAVAAVGAYAYFTSTGTGSGSASVGTSTTWAVTTDPAVLTNGPLTPGGPTETVAYHVKNNSTGFQKLQAVAISVANANGTDWTSVAGCSKSDFKIDAAAAGATQTDTPAVDLAPGAQYDGSITIQMVDTGSNQDGCKGATVPLYLSAS
jgi:hypothetical protein